MKEVGEKLIDIRKFEESMLPTGRLLQVEKKITTGWTMENYHFHDSYEINLSVSGGNDFFINERVYSVKPRDILVFNPEDLHKTNLPKDLTYERYLLFFHPNYIRSLSTEKTDLLELFEQRKRDFVHIRHLTAKNYEEVIKIFDEMIRLSNKESYGGDVEMKVLFAKLLLLINRAYQKEYKSDQEHSPSFRKVKPVLDYLSENYINAISLDELESQFYMDKYYLCELFKEATGFSLMQYVIHRRILYAKELLKEGRSVSQVAQLVGYHSDAHFIRSFKKLTGTTPKQYALHEGS